MIGNKIGIKSKKESTDQKKAPVQSKTGPTTKIHKKKTKSNFPEPKREEQREHSPRYKGSNARPQGKPKQSSPQNKPAGQHQPKPKQGQRPQPSAKVNAPEKEKPQDKPVHHKKVDLQTKKTDEIKKAVVHTDEDKERHRKSRAQRENIKPPALRSRDIVTSNKETEDTSLGSETAEDASSSIRIPEEVKEEKRKETEEKKSEHKKHSNEESIAEGHKIAEEKKALDDAWDLSSFDVPLMEGKMRFQDFDLPKPLMHAIYDLGFQYCTPIQQEIMEKSLSGKDAIGQAQTGTGKTAAFLITMLTRFYKNPIEGERRSGTPRALILAPTRELVMQIYKDALGFAKYMDVNIQAIFGGMDYAKQRKSLHARPVDIIMATPGRLIDFYDRRELHLKAVEIIVIDEADRMLDMGFIPDVKKIVRATPMKDKRQTLFFSATIDTDVMNLSQSWTTDSLNVKIEPDEVIVKNIEQIIYITTSDKKYPLLYNLITKQNLDKVMVFTNRRDEAKDLVQKLYANGIESDVLSGDVLQKKRVKTLEDFRNGIIKVLVATDVAGRGIHIENISHVLNYTLPEDPEDYVHRVGRTGRAGANGISISFATEDDAFSLPAIEEYVGKKFTYSYPEEADMTEPPAPVREPKQIVAADKPPLRKKKFSGKGGPHRGGPRQNRPPRT